MLIPGSEFRDEIESLLASIAVRRDYWSMMSGRYPLKVGWNDLWIDVFASVEPRTNKLLGFLDFNWTNGRLAVESAFMMRTHLGLSGAREFRKDVFNALGLCFDKGAMYVAWDCTSSNIRALPIYEDAIESGMAIKVGEFPNKILGMDGKLATIHSYAIFAGKWQKFKEGNGGVVPV